MEMVIFIGIPATGKSTFYRERFFDTHVRINLDMLRTRRREELLINACLEGKQPLVIDNTNVSREDRKPLIALARSTGFRCVGYYFQSRVGPCLERNARREAGGRIPEVAVRNKASLLEQPSLQEGFDQLFFVKIGEDGKYCVEEWQENHEF